MPNNAINSDVQQRRFGLFLHTGYGERSAKSTLRMDSLSTPQTMAVEDRSRSVFSVRVAPQGAIHG